MNRLTIKTLLGAGLVLAALAVLFLTVDLRLASSSTSTHSSVSKYTMGIPQGTESQMPSSIDVLVDGSDPLAVSVRRELRMQPAPAFGVPRLTLVESFATAEGRPVAVVRVRDGDVMWTPVYARTALKVELAYASDGDMSWRDEFTVRMSRTGNGPQVRVRGNLDLADSTTGVITEPAYRHHLAEQIVGIVNGALRQQLSS